MRLKFGKNHPPTSSVIKAPVNFNSKFPVVIKQVQPVDPMMSELKNVLEKNVTAVKEDVVVAPVVVSPPEVLGNPDNVYESTNDFNSETQTESIDEYVEKPNEISKVAKCQLNNYDVLDLTSQAEQVASKVANEVSESLTKSSVKQECKTLMDNVLQPKETAQFTIITDSAEDIIGFVFHILSENNFLHTSHVRRINNNTVDVVINNLSNKPVNFGIHYLAQF